MYENGFQSIVFKSKLHPRSRIELALGQSLVKLYPRIYLEFS